MLEYRYDTQLLIEGENLDEDAIHDYITENIKGDCLIAVGDEDLIKIHFHTNTPWTVLEYCASLGEIYDPWFNRGFRHFCSHQHAPYRTEPSGFDAGVMTDNVLYFAHPVFSIYRGFGMVYLQEFVVNALRRFLGAELQVETSLPTTGRVTFFDQPEEKRAVLHLLYANTVNRGGGGLHLLNQPLHLVGRLLRRVFRDLGQLFQPLAVGAGQVQRQLGAGGTDELIEHAGG